MQINENKNNFNTNVLIKPINTPQRINSFRSFPKNPDTSNTKFLPKKLPQPVEEVKNLCQKTFNFDDIIFTSEFNSGNMKQCTQKNENEFSILISQDCDGYNINHTISTFKIWFYFGVKSTKQKNIKIIIENLNNFYKVFKNGYKIAYAELPFDITPVTYQQSYEFNEEDYWKRLDIDYELFIDDKTNFLQVKFDYILPQNRYVLFSYCFPFSYEKNEAFLNYLSTKNINSDIYFHNEILTYSQEKRKIHLLTITSKSNVDFKKTEQTFPGLFPERKRNFITTHDKHIIFITARVHPGETPGTMMMNGILKTLFDKENPYSKMLLENFVFKIVPIINVDGVSHGHFRLDVNGYNLNRCYYNPDQNIHPENFAITKIFYFYAEKYKIRYYFDLHADMNVRGVYTFGNAISNFEEHVENVLFSFIFKLYSNHVNFCHCNFNEKSMMTRAKNDNAGKEATSRVQFHRRTGLIHTYTVESTYFKGEFNKDNSENEQSQIYLIKDFEQSGRDLLMSILDYEELTLSDNLLRSDYQTMEKCRKYIAQNVKFNEERFRFDFSLKNIVDNIENLRKWMTVKQIKEIRDKYELTRKMSMLKNNKNKKKVENSLINKTESNGNKNALSNSELRSAIGSRGDLNINKNNIFGKNYIKPLKNEISLNSNNTNIINKNRPLLRRKTSIHSIRSNIIPVNNGKKIGLESGKLQRLSRIVTNNQITPFNRKPANKFLKAISKNNSNNI